MKRLYKFIWKLRILRDTRGQDLIEYALLVSLVAVTAGAVVPEIADSIEIIFGKVRKALALASGRSTHHDDHSRL